MYNLIARCVYPWSLSADNVTFHVPESSHLVSNLPSSPSSSSTNLRLWNARLGHANFTDIKQLISRGAVIGMSTSDRFNNRESCKSCIKGKQTKKSLHVRKHRSEESCVVIHTDVCGPMSVASFSGCRYFVSFVDEYTWYIAIVLIVRKSDVLKHFKLYLAWVELTFSREERECRVTMAENLLHSNTAIL